MIGAEGVTLWAKLLPLFHGMSSFCEDLLVLRNGVWSSAAIEDLFTYLFADVGGDCMRVLESRGGSARFLTSTRGDEYQQLSCESCCNLIDFR